MGVQYNVVGRFNARWLRVLRGVLKQAPIHGLRYLLIAGVCFSSSAQAMPGFLVEPSTKELRAGEYLSLPLVVTGREGTRIELALGDGVPDEARLDVTQEGQVHLEWQTGPDLAEETLIELRIRDIDSKEMLEVKTVRIRRAEDVGATLDDVVNLNIGPFDNQKLRIGDAWHLPLDAPELVDGRVQILSRGLPPGAQLSRSVSGFRLDWTPKASQVGNWHMALRLMDAQQPTKFNEVPLKLTVGLESRHLQRNEGEFGKPDLMGLANQVVSTDQVVSLHVRASIEGEEATPTLQVDRLPGQASFDENSDGSRTFYWKPSKQDEGEHVFRFSATNPNNPRLRTSHEVLIVVGDPSTSRHYPTQVNVVQ